MCWADDRVMRDEERLNTVTEASHDLHAVGCLCWLRSCDAESPRICLFSCLRLLLHFTMLFCSYQFQLLSPGRLEGLAPKVSRGSHYFVVGLSLQKFGLALSYLHILE